ncbi:hypothetical protein ABMA27_010317 [Loxostege sticticalis]|uniref:DUF1758 domain-containing protein n=1 Tax=Loxostege sticticalis TaxID=481309 RepID=A0ABR3H5D0_LOXSC
MFLKLSIADRFKYVNDKNLCSNCLRGGHAIKDCWFGSCKHCNRKHNSLLHKDCADADASLSSSATVTQASQHTHTLHTATPRADNAINHDSNHIKSHSLAQHVLLSTALVEIADGNKKYHTFRALLDNGSQHCFISDSLCKKLNITKLQSSVQITGVGNCVTHTTQSCEIQLRSKTSSYSTRISCFVLPCITAQLPELQNHHNITIPDNIRLADPYFYSSNEIDLLLGADVFWDLLNKGLIRLPNGPYLQNTKLGWIISGSVFKNNNNNSHIHPVHCNFTLDSQLRRFWELEEINPSNKLSKTESSCEILFKETTTRDDAGRFSVRIPLTESADALGDSFTIAENRFRAIERKLDRCTPEYKQMYSGFMREYLSLGHMTRITDYTWPYYFLPHHGVFREHSTTTKLRVVFDASSKTNSGKSLNDIQSIGPALQNDLISILLRFRQFAFVACADIEKMYRQILIQPDQRNLQLILWRENPDEDIGVYRLNTVTYGTASAPFLSIRCLKQIALEHPDSVISQVINDDFYVDDLITGHDNKQTLIQICESVSKALQSACFPLRKWVFNSQSSDSPFKELSLGDHCETKTLGLM